jgi:hypothetical protein
MGIFIHLRDLSLQDELVKAFFKTNMPKKYHTEENKKMLQEFPESSQDRIVLLLDGFDEIAASEENITSTADVSQITIADLIFGREYSDMWIVISTRPNKMHLLQEVDCKDIEVVGFSDEQAIRYMAAHVGEKSHSSLVLELRERGLLSLSRAPLMLKMICFVYENLQEGEPLPYGFYKLYTQYFHLLVEYSRTSGRLGCTSVDLHKLLECLGVVAWTGWLEQRLWFRKADFVEKQPDPGADTSLVNTAVALGIMVEETQFVLAEMAARGTNDGVLP